MFIWVGLNKMYTYKETLTESTIPDPSLTLHLVID